MFKWFFQIRLHICVIITIFKNLEVFAQYNTPQNPCPDIFQYVNGNDAIEGQITLKFAIKDAFVNLLFEASIPEKLASVSL